MKFLSSTLTVLRILFGEVIYIVDEGGSVEICVNIEDTNFVIDEQLVFTLALAPVGGTASGKKHLVWSFF